MSKQFKSAGVRANENSFSSSEIDESVNLNVQNTLEADESSDAFEIEKIPKGRPRQSGSSSSVDYYAMKTKVNPQFKHPCKIEFQKLNTSLNKKIRQRTVTHHHELHPCTCQNYMSNPQMNAMNSQMSNQHFHAHSDSDVAPDNYNKSKSENGKIHKMFSCFTSNSFDRDSENCKVDSQQSNEKPQKTEYYPFDHGDHQSYHTTDRAPQLKSDNAAEKVHEHATKFWAEVFGTLNIGVTFFLVFFIQFYRFILYSFIRSIVVGFLQTTSDYLIKPILAMTFNGIIQPILQFIRNILESTWDTLEPLAHMIVGFCMPVIECLRSFRLIDMSTGGSKGKQRNESIV
ncbi:unnamed protein product [Chironomus riparius]|uniref:Uncharacterized protein n=1 Tax=Chironomus riparius TaxID=315576 RepID=A0A9N9S0F2_9DIPT|nr:unnamed protein product [Chironomus riparius]